jgi:predicted DNA-binding protein YlxM (UPF0122 family)
MEKRFELSLLMDFYAPLLTEHRRRVLEMYLNEDMGLQEIADTLGISRQGVHEAVKTASAQLMKYEEMLSIAHRYMSIRREVDVCREAIRRNDCEKALDALEKIDGMA